LHALGSIDQRRCLDTPGRTETLLVDRSVKTGYLILATTVSLPG
jgi:hypothetical protein